MPSLATREIHNCERLRFPAGRTHATEAAARKRREHNGLVINPGSTAAWTGIRYLADALIAVQRSHPEMASPVKTHRLTIRRKKRRGGLIAASDPSDLPRSDAPGEEQ